MGEVNVYPETRLLAHETRYRGNGDPQPADQKRKSRSKPGTSRQFQQDQRTFLGR